MIGEKQEKINYALWKKKTKNKQTVSSLNHKNKSSNLSILEYF